MSIHRSQNLSHQVAATQPIRNSTPISSMFGQNTHVGSSDKKSALLRQSSILSAKL